ncbi:f-box domain protein [Podospora aff. communis PSN243]|uniref:F-box domain protein n=1 Tax=Podospora aff. communis PSN243 TaxID=3040156 RepID=A0AAV9GPD0_9PEZI|nr:f-box domain protein [Podospora aff. communis PSN243]
MTTTTSHLQRLPEELCCRIAHLLDAKDAGSLRLTCKRLYAAATESLFSFVRLLPNEESVARYNDILASPSLNQLVKRVELNTLDPDGPWVEEEGFGAELEDDVLEAFKSFPSFTRLTGVTVGFSPRVSSDQGITEWPQDIGFRQSILRGLFSALAQPSASRINDVCFSNLQNWNDTSGNFMAFDDVVNVLGRLTALRLYIATELSDPEGEYQRQREYQDAHPLSRGIYLSELHSFMHQLPSAWLQPAAKNLTTLCLFQDFCFGFCPKLDLRGVHFPNLKTLAFGSYVFSHQWQLDWISSHSATLENLHLQECPVLHYMTFPGDAFSPDPEGYPDWRIFSNVGIAPRTSVYRANNLTWALILNHFRDHLQALRYFNSGISGPWTSNLTQGRRLHPLDNHVNGVYGRYDPGNFCYVGFEVTPAPPHYTAGPQALRTGVTASGDYQKAKAFFDNMPQQRKVDREALFKLRQRLGSLGPRDPVY